MISYMILRLARGNVSSSCIYLSNKNKKINDGILLNFSSQGTIDIINFSQPHDNFGVFFSGWNFKMVSNSFRFKSHRMHI